MGKSGKKKGKQEEDKSDISIANPSTSTSNSNVNSAVAALFSDDNPFRRKKRSEILESPAIKIQSAEKSDDLKKRKKNEGNEATGTLDLEKNKKLRSSEIEQQDGIDEGRNEKSVKKKRKRNEVEAEYESRRYGVVVEEEEKEEGKVVGRKRKKMEREEDLLVEKEGFDDESKLLRTVFVGNLPLKIKKKVLIKEFSNFGEVESVRIRSVPLKDSKIPRKAAVIKKQINDTADSVHAYVVFKTEESALASLVHNMALVGGNHIRVDRACPPRKKLKGDSTPLYDNRRTVFVGNLPFDVKDEELYRAFNEIKNLESCIEAIRIIRDPGTSLGKGIAYVLFKTREAATLAVKKHNLKLRDRELRLSHAKSNPTQSTTLKTAGSNQAKRKNPFPPEGDNSHSGKRGNSRFAGLESKMKSKTVMSYQGLRASKSGAEKKSFFQKKSNKSDTKSQSMPKVKERQQKRPSVAARKAEELKAKKAGAKRKPEHQTPDSNYRKKKARKFD